VTGDPNSPLAGEHGPDALGHGAAALVALVRASCLEMSDGQRVVGVLAMRARFRPRRDRRRRRAAGAGLLAVCVALALLARRGWSDTAPRHVECATTEACVPGVDTATAFRYCHGSEP
jgi:hypothetical protein